MLRDFYMLELYFGSAAATMSLEQLIKQYGRAEVVKNIANGFLQTKAGRCLSGAEPAACLCWLSDKGRSRLMDSL
ncbi:MAG: hypothetical protein CMH27_07515 [Micavibrio sp.]|nr:hypothetical protein [Micavibrio sp.]|tara:strand:- start:460 stop:684 length:225 start_codon:yes stop_codon:yes gene_type:complete